MSFVVLELSSDEEPSGSGSVKKRRRNSRPPETVITLGGDDDDDDDSDVVFCDGDSDEVVLVAEDTGVHSGAQRAPHTSRHKRPRDGGGLRAMKRSINRANGQGVCAPYGG